MLFIWQFFLLILLILIPYSLYRVGRADLEYNYKLIWCLLIIFVPVLGAIAYLLVGNSKKTSQHN
ncbi:PLD nuclease N-terminal domain-containing protein [Myroides marinus]|uniref:PLD nuclease N-terminal domain-containing protein n=1 Tax=Myroides marinus TaxID=703342 RepID=UPI001F0A7398|nr:PLD nuclease N-terminal domain-containing protein [Myroides marinus]